MPEPTAPDPAGSDATSGRLYVPPANRVDDAALREMVRAFATAELITVGADGFPRATLLPVLWRGDTVVAHMARANSHWRDIVADAPALLVCGGAQAYVSPAWYASKAEHGRVVPTWNYSSVHLRGRARVVDDAGWLREAVDDLTRAHEDQREQPWHTDDAPSAFIAGQLRGIVGVEIRVEHATGKAKLSQNRSDADRAGVIDGLAGEPGAGAAEVRAAMLGDVVPPR